MIYFLTLSEPSTDTLLVISTSHFSFWLPCSCSPMYSLSSCPLTEMTRSQNLLFCQITDSKNLKHREGSFPPSWLNYHAYIQYEIAFYGISSYFHLARLPLLISAYVFWYSPYSVSLCFVFFTDIINITQSWMILNDALFF